MVTSNCSRIVVLAVMLVASLAVSSLGSARAWAQSAPPESSTVAGPEEGSSTQTDTSAPAAAVGSSAATAHPDIDSLDVAQLRAELGHPDLEWRVTVIRELGARRAGEALPELLVLLRSDPSSEARGWAARALGEIDTPAARDALVDAVRRDPDVRLRRLAAHLSGTSATDLPWEPGQGEPTVAPPEAQRGGFGLPPALERELRLREIDRATSPPASGSSTALIALNATVDLVGIPLMLTGTVIPPFAAGGLFTMPFVMADSIFLSVQQRAVERRGLEVNGAPQGVCWLLTAFSFAGAWVGSHMAFMLEWEGGPAYSTGIALVALSAVSEVVNFFLRTFWWRPAISGPYRDYILGGAELDPEEL